MTPLFGQIWQVIQADLPKGRSALEGIEIEKRNEEIMQQGGDNKIARSNSDQVLAIDLSLRYRAQDHQQHIHIK